MHTGQLEHSTPVSRQINSATIFILSSYLRYNYFKAKSTQLCVRRQPCVYDMCYHKSRGNTASPWARVTVMLSRLPLLHCVMTEVKEREGYAQEKCSLFGTSNLQSALIFER